MGRLKREITVDQTGMDPQRKSTGLYKKQGFCQKNVAKVTLVMLGDKCDVSVTQKKLSIDSLKALDCSTISYEGPGIYTTTGS